MNWKQKSFRTVGIALLVLMAVMSTAAPVLGQSVGNVTPAELTVEQPRHISDPVEETTENGTRMYVARGQYLEIEPLNFNQSDVTAFSVQESEAVLSYDKSDTEYVLNTQDNTGTFHLTWTVSGNQTTTYRAAIRVVESDYAVLPANQLESIRQKGQRGAEIIERFEEAGDPDQPVEQKVEWSVQALNFLENPFSVFTGQFIALQTLRFMTPAGWVDLGITVVLFYVLTRGMYSTLARLRKQLEKEEKVSRREDVQYLKMYKQVLAGKQMSDVDGIDDHQAAILEERLGPNLFTALRNFWTTWGAESLKRMYVDAMGAVGYTARVRRDGEGAVSDLEILDPGSRDPVADGGEPEDGEDRREFMNLSSAPGEVLDKITWDDVDKRVFQKNPDISAVDHLMTANRDRPGDLISDMAISIPEDFQSRHAFMEAIGRFLAHVQETEFTDEDNYPREDRTVLNHVMAFTTTLEQEYGVPLDLWWRAAIWNAEGLDRDDEARSVLNDITDAGTVVDEPGDDGPIGGGSVGS